jgi:ketosteroid isomerase-like protein
MTSTHTLTPAELARSAFAANDARDIDALSELVTDDVRLTFGNAGTVTGRDAFRKASADFNASLDSFSHEITALFEVADAGVVVAELSVSYRRLDGRELTLPCCNVFRIRDGRIADYRIYMDINPVFA